MLKRQRSLLADFDVQEIEIPDAFCLFSFIEENEIGFHACARAGKNAAWQAHDAIDVAILDQLSLRLHETAFVRAKEHAFIEHDAARAAVLHALEDMLDEQHLRRARDRWPRK